MAAKKARKRAYIPPSSEIVNRRERTTSSTTTRSTVQRSNAGGGRGAIEHPTPSINRTLRRLPIYFVLIFALQYWLLSRDAKGPEGTELLLAAAASAGLVTVIFAPFMHMMDRLAYNRHQRSGDGSSKR